jgi:U3 small nucleolar RNA-associated protein 22
LFTKINFQLDFAFLKKSLQQKHNCFSGVCRLAKRWLASHFLLEYFEEEAVDLLCAYLFVQTISYEPPRLIFIYSFMQVIFVSFKENFFILFQRSIMAGFHRFLDLMSSFDWKNQFLLVNFNNDLTSNFRVALNF